MKEPMETIRAVASDDKRGAAQLAKRAASALLQIETRREVIRAARILLRAKGAMAPMWRILTLALQEPGGAAPLRFADQLLQRQATAASNARWLGTGRSLVIVTWSDASALTLALDALAPRIEEVRCGLSEPGGEGRRLAARVRRRGISSSVFLDADASRALDGADIVLVGADAIGASMANKTGTRMLVTLARAASVPAYAIAPSSKLLPSSLVELAAAGAFEPLDASLLDAVITEDGPRSARWLAPRGEEVEIASDLVRLIS